MQPPEPNDEPVQPTPDRLVWLLEALARYEGQGELAPRQRLALMLNALLEQIKLNGNAQRDGGSALLLAEAVAALVQLDKGVVEPLLVPGPAAGNAPKQTPQIREHLIRMCVHHIMRTEQVGRPTAEQEFSLRTDIPLSAIRTAMSAKARFRASGGTLTLDDHLDPNTPDLAQLSPHERDAELDRRYQRAVQAIGVLPRHMRKKRFS